MEIRFSVLVVLIVFLALNAAVQLRTLAAVQGLAAQQHAISPPGTDAPALEILSTRNAVYAGRRVHVEARLNPIYSTVILKEYFILKFCQFNKRTCHFISSKIIS